MGFGEGEADIHKEKRIQVGEMKIRRKLLEERMVVVRKRVVVVMVER